MWRQRWNRATSKTGAETIRSSCPSGRRAKDGANSRDRTDDLRITNALLYQLSYIGLYKNGVDDSENRATVNTGLRHDADQH